MSELVQDQIKNTVLEISTEPSNIPTPSPNQDPPWLHIAKQSEKMFTGNGFKKRLAIVGFAPTRDLAPYTDPSWEIWGLNDLHRAIPRYTRWFDIHTEQNIETDYIAGRTSNAQRKTNIPETALEQLGISGLSKLKVPVYMQEVNPKVPMSLKYPLKEMLDFWKGRGLTGATYFTNSISYMIAFALYEGAVLGHQWDDIHIYGVDMAVGDEYIAQRPSCEYWIGIAEGMGVKVYIPDASDLCKTTFLYAWEEVAQKAFENKMKKIRDDAAMRKQAFESQKAELDRLIHHCEAQIGTVSDLSRVWSNNDSKFIH